MYDDAQDALAAEYVLGTLTADEREHAEALMEIDPGFADAVRQWERRLGELNVMVEAIEPPPELWDKIRDEIAGVAQPPEIPVSAVAAGQSEPAAEPAEPAEPAELAELTEPAEPAPDVETAAAFEVAGLSPVPDIAPADEILEPMGEERPEGEPQEEPQEEPQKEPSEAPLAIGEAPPAAGEPDLSDTIAASLARSLAEPPGPRPAPPRGEAERSAEVIRLRRRAARWRSVTVLMGAVAAVLALYVGLAQFAPGLVPFGPLASQPPAQLGVRLVAALQQEPTGPAFLLTIDPASRTMVVRRVSATAEPGHSYELWLIAKGVPAPRSLGLIGAEEYTQRPIPTAFDMATLRSARYAVSLEPTGGSPSGVPTGPVLFTGNIVQSVPPAPPPPPPSGPSKT